MNKNIAVLLIIFMVAIISFASWQLFAGRFDAAFSVLPVMVITYLYLLRLKRSQG